VKIQYALPLAVAIGLGFGAIRGLDARTTAPPVYLVVEIDEVTDAKGFEALRQTADATAVEGLLNEYFVSITSSGKPPQWQWEIKRRPNPPLGVKIYANGFKSEKAAKLAGEKALRELLDGIAREQS
jgi:hypothetical protein